MSRHRGFGLLFSLAGATVMWATPPTFAQTNPSGQQPSRTATPQAAAGADSIAPALTILRALQANPITAPYPIKAAMKGNTVILSGRVGTKPIHDAAIQMAIATGIRFRDDLTIDTAEAHRVAALSAMPAPGWPGSASASLAAMRAGGIPSLGAIPYTLGNQPYIYPPPLFGRLYDPFFGFEPPLLSYPPWWRAVAAREGINLPGPTIPGGAAGVGMPGGGAAVTGNPPVSSPSQQPANGSTVSVPLGPNAEDGTIEMTLDSRGVATLHGTVPSLADRIAIGQAIARMPGISEVLNLLNVGRVVGLNTPPPPEPAAGPGATPPLPPQAAPVAEADQPPRRAGLAVDADGLNDRLRQAIAHRPALADLPIKIAVRDGVATLSGKVPTVYEAMLAYRAVQQTPGVHDVIDRLEFTVPDGEKKNPLRDKGRPEDVEPYLIAQIRRQAGDLAHIDQVRVRGDSLEVRGTLLHAEDRPRLEAILRSMPILRVFRLEPTFVVD